ncbi:MAG: NAD-dependent epimerase/dehydratase family protein [Steroidobacteraceae bacterium]
MTRVLITGGAGFIGSNLALQFFSVGCEVTVLDNLLPQVHSAAPESSPLYQSIRDKVAFVRGSVGDPGILSRILPSQDLLVHLAAETGTGQSMYEIDRYVTTNVGGTGLLLDLLGRTKHSIKRVVVASSRAIYGEGKYLRADGTAVYPSHRRVADLEAGRFEIFDQVDGEKLEATATDEDSRLHSSSVYGITKQTQEQLVMTVCPTLGIEPVALRYQNVYGPGQSLSNPYTGILSIFSNLIMNGKAINIFEDGRESRDFVFIDDVVRATMLAATHPRAANQVFNVGSGLPTPVSTVADSLMKAFGTEVPAKITGAFRLGDIRHNIADLTRIRNLLGYAPRVSFDEGIRRFVEWARSIGPTDSAYQESIDEMKARGLLK